MSADFSDVTEGVGDRLRPEAIAMMHTRHRLAAEGKDVLEVACGAAHGVQQPVELAPTETGGRWRLLSLDAAAP